MADVQDKITELYGLLPKGSFKDETELRGYVTDESKLKEVFGLMPQGSFKDENEYLGYFGDSIKKKVLPLDLASQGQTVLQDFGQPLNEPSTQPLPSTSDNFKKTQLSPEEEVTFQQWKGNEPENDLYDFRGFYQAESDGGTLKPTMADYFKEDPNYHFYSVGRDGKILKSPQHPTFEKTVKGEADAGNEIYTDKQGVLKSKPKTAKTVGEWVLGGVKAFDQSLASLAGTLDYVHTSASDVINQIILGKEDAVKFKKMREEGTLAPILNPVRPFQAIEDAINYAHSGAKPLPETVGGKIVSGAAGVVPDIIAAMYAPEVRLPSMFNKLGLKVGSQFGMVMGAKAAIEGAEANQGESTFRKVEAPILGAIEGYMTGWMFDGFSNVSGDIGKRIADKIIPKVVTQTQAIDKALVQQGGSMLSNAIIFGGYGNAEEYLRTGTISAETFATNAGMGIALGLKEPAKLLYAKGLNAFIATPKVAINRMVSDKTTPEEFAKTAQDKIAAIESGDSPNREGDLAVAKLNANLAGLNAIVDEIRTNKEEVLKSVNESTLEPKAKELIVDKINEVDADNDPKVQAIKPINEKIVKIDHALKDIADNESWSDTMKEVESAPLKERREELKQEAKEKGYGIKPEVKAEGAVEKPKAVQTESSKKLLDEIDKPKLKEETQNGKEENGITKDEENGKDDGRDGEVQSQKENEGQKEDVKTPVTIGERTTISKGERNMKFIKNRIDENADLFKVPIRNEGNEIGAAIIDNTPEGWRIKRIDVERTEGIPRGSGREAMRLLNQEAAKDGKVLLSDFAGMQSTNMKSAWAKLVASGEAEQLPDGSWAFIKPKVAEGGVPPKVEEVPLEGESKESTTVSEIDKKVEEVQTENVPKSPLTDNTETNPVLPLNNASEALTPQSDTNVPPKPPAVKNTIETTGLSGLHKIGLRAAVSTVLGDEIKTAVREQGIEYAVRGKNVRQSEAKEYVKLYAEEGQLGTLEEEVYDRDNGISGDTRTALNVYIAKHYVDKLNESTDLTERKEIISHLRKSIAFGQEQATRAGEVVEAQKDWKDVLGENPELSVHFTRERVAREQEEMFKANEKEVDEGYKTLNDFLKSEEIVKIIDEKVSEEISKIGTKRFGVTDKKKIDDFFEGLKVKTEGKLFDATIAIPITIYNGSIEVIKRSIMAGMDIANAVQAGIDNLDKWHKEKYDKDEVSSPEWRKDDYRASLTEKLKPLVKSVSKIKVSDVPKAKYKTLVEKMYAKMPMASKSQLRMLVKNALEELATTGEISKEQFRNELARALGKTHITDAQEMDLFNAGMAMKNVRKKGEEVNKAFDEYEKENANTKPDKAKLKELKKKVDDTIKEATRAIFNAQKEQKKTDEIFTDTPDWVDTFVTNIKGNLLTIPSLVVNLTSNVGAPLIRMPKNAIASSLDWMISGVAKTYEPIIKKIDPEKSPWLYRQASKLPGSQRTTDYLAYMRGAPRGLKRGIVKGAKQIVTGALPEELLAREINRSLHPIDAAIRLVDMTKGNVPTSVGKYVQAILEAGPWSYNAEFMFRMLNMGDKPFKEPHYIGRLEEIASLKGLTGIAKERFIEQPDEVSEADAKKTADIAVWQNDNAITKWLRDIEKATKHDKSKKDLKQAIMQSTVVRTIARLGLATNAPYVKTPTNLIKEGFEYAIPAYSLLRAAESAYNGNRRQALDFIGKAVVGTIVGSIAANLVSNGLISPPPSKDDKERAQQYDQDMPYMLNVTATIRHINGEDTKWREGDFKVSIKPYGIMSSLLMAHVKAYSEVEPSKIKDMSYLDNMTKVVPSVISSSLDQSFLAGTSVGLTAFIKGGPEMDKYLVSTSRALSSAVYPNNAATLSKTFFSKNFIRETKDLSIQGENVQKQIQNDFRDRMFMGKQLPTKVSIWGQKVNRVPDGRNWPYMLFDVTKYEKQQETTFGTKIWGLYKDYKWLNKEDATKLLPSLPSISTEVGWEDSKMTPTEVEDFQIDVGEKRAIYAQHYVDSDQWEEDGNIIRGETLTKLYNQARREALAENFDWDETKRKYSKEWQETYDLGVIPLPSMNRMFGGKKFSDEDVAMYNRIAADNYMQEIAKRKDDFKTKTEDEKIRLANGLWKKHIALAKKQIWDGKK